MPRFVALTWQSLRQVQRAEGFHGGSLLADRKFTFWTMSTWESQAAMRKYMTAGSHKEAMPKLLDWCDEASVVHWDNADRAPTWQEASDRMRTGRASKVRNPSPQHDDLRYIEPRLAGAVPIKAKKKAA